MASATVLLKEGKSYTYSDGPNSITFREGLAQPVHGDDLITKLETISCLAVERHVDKPVTPLKATVGKKLAGKPAPAPEPEPEEEPEDEVDADAGDEGEAQETEGDDGDAVDPEPEETEADPEPVVEQVKPAKGKPGPKGKKG